MKRLGQLLTAVYSRRPFLLCLIGSTVLLVITASTLTLRYNSNDDVLMAEIAAGIVTGEPSPFLIFQHIVLGWVLTVLYGITDTVPWYALQLYAIHALSAAGLFLALCGRTLSIRGVFLSLVAYVIFVLPFALHLQFTTVSASAAVNGIVLLLASVRKEKDTAALPRSGRFERYLGSFLVVVSSLVRFKACVLVVLVAAPFIAFWLWRYRSVQLFKTLLVTGLSAVVLMGVNSAVYHMDEGWAAYRELSAVRTQLHDKPSVFTARKNLGQEDKPALDRIGWSLNDAKCLRAHFYPDPEVFSTDKIKSALLNFSGFHWKWDQAYRTQLNTLAKFSISLMWFPILLLLFRMRKWRWHFAAVSGSALIGLGLAFYLAYTAKLPNRVWLPLYGIPGWLAFFVFSQSPTPFPKGYSLRLGKVVSVVCALIMLSAVIYRLKRTVQDDRVHAAQQKEMLDGLSLIRTKLVHSNRTVVALMGLNLRLEWLSPLTGTQQMRGLNLFFLSGWLFHSPLYKQQLEKRGIRDVYTYLATHKDLLIISTRQKTRQCFQDFIKEHRPDLKARLKMLEIHRPKLLREALYQVEPYQ